MNETRKKLLRNIEMLSFLAWISYLTLRRHFLLYILPFRTKIIPRSNWAAQSMHWSCHQKCGLPQLWPHLNEIQQCTLQYQMVIANILRSSHTKQNVSDECGLASKHLTFDCCRNCNCSCELRDLQWLMLAFDLDNTCNAPKYRLEICCLCSCPQYFCWRKTHFIS